MKMFITVIATAFAVLTLSDMAAQAGDQSSVVIDGLFLMLFGAGLEWATTGDRY